MKPILTSDTRHTGVRFRPILGVTLIELLTVVAVMAILASIAVGSYRRYVLRANRTDATAALLRIQVAEEKFFLQNNTYTASFGQTGLNMGGTTSLTTPNGYYSVTIAGDPGSTNNIATSFLATATPQGGQTKDTSCPTLTINDQGVHGPATTAATCWR